MWLNRLTKQWIDLPRPARVAVPFLLGMVAALGQAPFEVPLLSLVAFAAGFALLTVTEGPKQAARLGWLAREAEVGRDNNNNVSTQVQSLFLFYFCL